MEDSTVSCLLWVEQHRTYFAVIYVCATVNYNGTWSHLRSIIPTPCNGLIGWQNLNADGSYVLQDSVAISCEFHLQFWTSICMYKTAKCEWPLPLLIVTPLTRLETGWNTHAIE